MTQVDDFVTTSDGRRVIRAFLRADVRLRHRIVALVEKIVDDDANRTRDPGVRFGRPRKLTPQQREEALRRLAAGETQADVARTYNVDPTTIGRYRC
jgi:DNA-binding NarL/FixJ family response regulator